MSSGGSLKLKIPHEVVGMCLELTTKYPLRGKFLGVQSTLLCGDMQWNVISSPGAKMMMIC